MKDRAPINAAAASPAGPDRRLSQAAELRPSVWALCSEGLQSPLISTGRNGLGEQPALRPARVLRLHPAFNELNLAGWLINSELQGKPRDVHEPILITKNSILVAGFAEWHAAECAGQAEIDCIEFALDDDEVLQLILSLHRPRATWNDFTRTELALEQESYFHSKARANQIAGGEHNGLANSARPLPIARNQSHSIGSDAHSRTESGCSAGLYAPQYAPRRTELSQQADHRRSGLASCAVADLRPHLSPDDNDQTVSNQASGSWRCTL